jgi:hypothetical protein
MGARELTIDPWDLAILRYLARGLPEWVRRSSTTLHEAFAGHLELLVRPEGTVPALRPFARRLGRLRELFLVRYSPEDVDGPPLWALTYAGETFVELLSKEGRG